MKTNRILQYLAMATCAVMFAFVTGCEGPEGPAGADGADGTDGTNGTNGADANETCKLCHNPESVDLITTQFQLSKHEYGEAAFEEAGNTGCTPCHAQEAFKYVVEEEVGVDFNTLGPPTQTSPAGVYVNAYQASASTAFGEVGCSTCHSSIHDTYTAADIPSLTTVAAVPMTMWGGNKTVDLPQDGGTSNLCVKCHQPRPMTINNAVWTSGGTAQPTGNPVDYTALTVVADYNNPVWTGTSASGGYGYYKPSYRSHVHYGTVGAVFAGKGGVEFTGSESYANSKHTEVASCQDCHMAEGMNGRAGGHTFVAKGNFNGCNVTGCHSTSPIDANNGAYWKDPRKKIKDLLDQIGTLLVVTHNDGTTYNLLNVNTNTSESAVYLNATTGVSTPIGVNLWADLTTAKYDGYLNIVNSANVKPGQAKVIPNTWFTLTQAQLGAMINFQFGLREYSSGIHNYKYTHALLHNTVIALGGTPVN